MERLDHTIQCTEVRTLKPTDYWGEHWFLVSAGHARRKCIVRFDLNMKPIPHLAGRPVKFATVALYAGLGDLEAALIAGRFDSSDEEPFVIEYSSEAADLLQNEVDLGKRCRWREPIDPRGYHCKACGESSQRETTLSCCERCGVPDSRIVCSCFVSPSVTLDSGPGGARDPLFSGALCTSNHAIGNATDCTPGKQCWKRVVS